MRKSISIILAVCLLMSFALPVMAEEKAPSINPRYTYIRKLDGTLSIDGSGTAHCFAEGGVHDPSLKVYLICQLQGYNGSSWIIVRSWTATNLYDASLSKTATTSSDYSDYRLRVTCRVYNSADTLLESATYYVY